MDAQLLFGSRIRSIREAAGFSREVSAEKSDINANYLGEIERGEKWPSLEVIQHLAATLQVSPAAFFEFESEQVDPKALRATVVELLGKRETEDLQQAVRVLKALFRM
jgi:transcriptional regulator with XRE-family HTH domain